jgi:hypothetical protein
MRDPVDQEVARARWRRRQAFRLALRLFERTSWLRVVDFLIMPLS